MVDLNTSLRDLPVELKALVLSHIEHVKTRQILALSSTFQEAFPLPGALPRTFDFEGVAGDDIVDLVVRLLDDDRVRSLGKERAVELIGVYKDRLCEYACGRNFEVLKWAHNELDLPWAPYPAGRVSDDVLVLRVLRAIYLRIEWRWPKDSGPEEWSGVKMVDGRVVKLELRCLTGAVPAEIWQLTSLELLHLSGNQLTRVPAEIGQLTSLEALYLHDNQLTSVPAEIWQLTSLELLAPRRQSADERAGGDRAAHVAGLTLNDNKLTSVPAEIWQLTSLTELHLHSNRLTSVPAEIGQLTSLECLTLNDNQLTSVPAEIGQLTSLEGLWLNDNKLTTVPAEIGQLTSLKELHLYDNQLTSAGAAIRELRAVRCDVHLDDGVTMDDL